MKFIFHSLIMTAALFCGGFSAVAQTQVQLQETDPLLAEVKVFPYEWNPGQGGTLEIKMRLPAAFHAYEDKFKVVILEPDGFQIAPFKVEPLKKWYDKFSKKERWGVEGESTLTAHIEAPNRFLKRYDKMKLELTYQACSDQFCLFPTTKSLEVPITVSMVEGDSLLKEGLAPHSGSAPFFDIGNFQRFLGNSLFAGLIFVFLAGIFTSFTPCIFPMIPITLAVLGNHSTERTRLQNFVTSCIYVLG
ncbi:MAG: protein-disulfide reductase DsbD domain-containing protein, partial [Bdellovibrio sp.]